MVIAYFLLAETCVHVQLSSIISVLDDIPPPCGTSYPGMGKILKLVRALLHCGKI